MSVHTLESSFQSFSHMSFCKLSPRYTEMYFNLDDNEFTGSTYTDRHRQTLSHACKSL